MNNIKNIKSAVVKIISFTSSEDVYKPYETKKLGTGTGTGFFIKK